MGAAERGITLVELAIVLACSCVLLAAAVPGIQAIQQELALWHDARLVESILRWGRYHAVTANEAVAFIVDEGGARCYFSIAATGEPCASSIRYMSRGVRVAGVPRRPVRFFPSGFAAPAGTYTLQGAAGAYRVVVQFSGRIRLQRD